MKHTGADLHQGLFFLGFFLCKNFFCDLLRGFVKGSIILHRVFLCISPYDLKGCSNIIIQLLALGCCLKMFTLKVSIRIKKLIHELELQKLMNAGLIDLRLQPFFQIIKNFLFFLFQ